MQAIQRLSEETIHKLRNEINDSQGNEVFALGYCSGGKAEALSLVTRIEVRARGNVAAVLALDDAKTAADVFIHNHPSGFLSPSDNDLAIAARAAEAGIGFYIVDNRVEQVYVVAESIKKRHVSPLDPESLTAALEPGGAISKRLPTYEIREAQLACMQMIIRGFNEDAIVAAEAGTGVGKSFAYLLPALQYAYANDERIVISTATITLQEQLFNKDIPLVSAGLGKDIKTVLVKGRGNYLCRRRLNDALREPSLDSDEQQQIEDIARWAETTPTGSRSDLSFMPGEGIWSRVCSESDNCMNLRCNERERCFVMLLRREAADARILVVNHHLLFADLAARYEGAGYDSTVVLPPYHRVIIDEAHTIEEAATSFFSKEFSRLGIYRQLSRLYRKRGASRKGLLLRLAALLPSLSINRMLDDDNEGFTDKIETLISAARKAIDDLDEAALELCARDGVFRLTPDKDDYIQARLSPECVALRKRLEALAAFVRNLLEEAEASSAELDHTTSESDGYGNEHAETKDESVVWELRSALRRLDMVASVCTSFIEYRENPDKVAWLQRRSSKGGKDAPWAEFSITPLDVAPALKDALFTPNKTVVCVSATLTTGNTFEYWKNRTGLDRSTDREIISGIFPSPFPYDTNVLLAAPHDMPLPSEAGYDAFVDRAAAALTEASGGSALVLFTSYQALHSAYEAAIPVLQKQGIRVLKQGDDDRNRLLTAFLEDESSVLFATDSFWEGVDAPGDTLRLVILCRLPFRSPSDPVFQARCEALDNSGGNSFMELSLPEAVMKFKQGFGRLMRRSSDHGVVVVLDGRLLKKRYGEIFLRSLPETRTCFSGFSNVLRSMEDFLY